MSAERPIHDCFLTALFVRVKIWHQSKYPLTGEWLKKVWRVHIMQLYSAVGRNERLLRTTTWRALKGVMLNEQKLISKNMFI